MTFNTIRTGWIILRELLNEKAVKHCSKALRINPEFAETHNGLGVVLANQGRINEAIIQFSEAL
jgi:Flp pilus assembly protein TadD